MLDNDRIRGVLAGLAIGDALGAPVHGMSHQNVRTHYRGIKGPVADARRADHASGQGTDHTRRALALARALGAPADADALRVTIAEAAPGTAGVAGAACAAPAGVVAARRGLDDAALTALLAGWLGPLVASPEALSAATGQARAVALALAADPASLDGPAFIHSVAAAATASGGAAVPARLLALADHLDETPLDLHDRAGGTGGAPDEAFPFAVAMFARAPALVEATLLSAINVGGAASAVGAMAGALLGAFNGAGAFPAEWSEAVEAGEELASVAGDLVG